MHRLNTTPDQPLVLTSRRGEYAIAVAGTDVLTAAAGIELDELTLNDLADYLPRTTRRVTVHDGHTTQLWDPVLNHLAEHQTAPASGVLRQALSTPLMVYLARTIYSDTPESNPLDLLDVTRFSTVEAVEQHLIAAYLPAIYQHTAPTGRTWHASQAHRSLAYLARHLDRLGTRDLAWWQLREATPRATRYVVLAIALGLSGGLLGGLSGGPVDWLTAGSTFGLKFGLVMGLAVGLVVGLAGGLLGEAQGGPAPTRTHLRIHGRVYEVTRTSMAALAFSLGIGLVIGLAGGLTDGRAYGLSDGIAGGPTGAMTFGLAFGAVVAVAAVSMLTLETTIDITAEARPSDSLINDRRNTIRKIVTFGSLFGLALGLAGGLTGAIEGGLAGGITFGLGFGLPFGLAVGLGFSAWGHWLTLVRLWLPLTGRLPWPVQAFLTDAHQRGILRQVGAVYQFRHARLQHHLSAHPTTPEDPE